MMTRPPAPDDQPPGNGHRGAAAATLVVPAGSPEAQRARLTAFWALVLRRFRDYATGPHRTRTRNASEEDR